MMGLIAMLVRSESLVVGWGVHVVIVVLLSIGFAIFAAIVPLLAWVNAAWSTPRVSG